MTYKKKLIEVALPLDAINTESLRRKTKAPKGWPTTFHKWWAQRPLAAARAVIFAQLVDDPSAHPNLFPTEKKQEKERQRLFRIIKDLVLWENTTNEVVLQKARDEIWASWRRTCAENADHPKSAKLFNRQQLPPFWDPFAGGGSIPISAQWLGLKSYASDLNPVAVLINKAILEIPPKFAGIPPVNPEARKENLLIAREWKGAQGLAEDVRYYGQRIREEAEKRIAHLYPKARITAEMMKEQPDLKKYVGRELSVIAWIWVRTVKSPNPAFAQMDVPLASTFMLSTKAGKEAYVEPVIENDGYRFIVKVGKPKDAKAVKNGTKLSRGANFQCLMSGTPIASDYIKAEGKAGRMGVRLMAIVAEGDRGRVYLSPIQQHEVVAQTAKPEWKPEVTISGSTQYLGVKPYGIERFDQLFTDRQLVVLVALSDAANIVREHVRCDGAKAGLSDDEIPLREGGGGATAYAEAISVYLACMVDRIAYYGSTLVGWLPKDNALGPSMPRQAIAMSWDFVEANPFGKSSGDVSTCAKAVANYLDVATTFASGNVMQADAQVGHNDVEGMVISTDPPYYDNVPYADLSDYFYVWLRLQLKEIFPDLFATLATPKTEELVAFAHRHNNGRAGAETFFLDGITKAMSRFAELKHPAFPITIYYAFKQAEDDGENGTASTGWETFLSGVISAGFSISGTWPLRTEGKNRMRSINSNALASSIILVCRKRATAATATRQEFISKLKVELPMALAHLQRGNIAPVDLAQAAIGPGIEVYTRYAKVLDAKGKSVTVRDALALINQTLDEVLAEQEGDFDVDTRWALAWFEQVGVGEGDFGLADVLARAKNTSVAGLVEAGIIESGHGKVRLWKPNELPTDWDPNTDKRLTNWEMVHHLIRVLEANGESATSKIMAKLGSKAEVARELCYRLYNLCEKKKRVEEALSYNGLVQSWVEIMRLAREDGRPQDEQADLFNDNEE